MAFKLSIFAAVAVFILIIAYVFNIEQQTPTGRMHKTMRKYQESVVSLNDAITMTLKESKCQQ